MINNTREFKTQLFFKWIDDLELKTQLTLKVKTSKEARTETQKELSEMLDISLTKIKEIENGKCKDFNAINNYLNYNNQSLIL
ncbi:hypothetical protein [Thalassobellus citreus]|uniref:hypothetical protein n=1 Tax=Thalassobellus citreus TaxID=3367752 RepID=UPI0037BB6F48